MAMKGGEREAKRKKKKITKMGGGRWSIQQRLQRHRKRTEPETKGGVDWIDRQKQHGSSSRSIDPWYYADVHVSGT